MTRTEKNNVKIIALVVAICTLFTAFVIFAGKKTGGFSDDVTIENLTKKELNEDNLYSADLLTIERYNAGTGIVIDTEDDGVIVLDGKLGGENAVDVKVATVELKTGTYTMTTDAPVGQYTAYMYATADNGSTKLAFDFGGTKTDGVFEIAAADTYDIYIHVEPDVEFTHTHFYPTIVNGDEAGEFYAD